MTEVAAHLLVFAICGVVLFIAPLVIGRWIRPNRPSPSKEAIYECGEPTIGSSFVQFDLRFYVVALLFIVFDVELVFFFPWAQVFGSANQLADTAISRPAAELLTTNLFPELTSEHFTPGAPEVLSSHSAQMLGWMGFADVVIFFAVLLVGFAYLWKRGDLDWVRTEQLRGRAGAEGSAANAPAN